MARHILFVKNSETAEPLGTVLLRTWMGVTYIGMALGIYNGPGGNLSVRGVWEDTWVSVRGKVSFLIKFSTQAKSVFRGIGFFLLRCKQNGLLIQPFNVQFDF